MCLCAPQAVLLFQQGRYAEVITVLEPACAELEVLHNG
jgi:hypothetical protein